VHSATIPLAALATFAGVYWLAPAPAAQEAQPLPAAEAARPAVGAVDTPRASVVPAAAANRSKVRRARPPARPRARLAAAARAVRPARRSPAVSVYFSGCNEVRAAGLAPLLRGQPGYRPEMDGDDDGVACEARRRW
jgi:hypothetical protein